MKTQDLSQDGLLTCYLKIPALKVYKQTIESMMVTKFGSVQVCGWCMVNIEHFIDLLLEGDKISHLLTTVVVKYKKA